MTTIQREQERTDGLVAGAEALAYMATRLRQIGTTDTGLEQRASGYIISAGREIIGNSTDQGKRFGRLTEAFLSVTGRR